MRGYLVSEDRQALYRASNRPFFFASKQTAVEMVLAARQDADALDVRMFGIEENICV
jgi:hypothetical protein